MSSTTPVQPRRRRTRAVRDALVVVVLAAGVGAAVWVTNRPEDEPEAAEVEVFKAEAVESGTLASTERVDGRLERLSGLSVRHRIEGESAATSSADAATGSSGPNGESTSNGPLGFAAIEDAPAEVETVEPVESTTPDTTTPDTTTSAGNGDGSSAGGSDPGPGTDPGGSSSGGGDTPGTGSLPSSSSRPGATPGASSAGVGAAGGTSTSTTRTLELVTSVAAVGSAVTSGDVLYTVEGRAVVALTGALPAWRTLEDGVDDGVDVEQLERALVALGYDRDGEVTVDQEFDSATAAMVERWQSGHGAPVTGIVELGAVVFIPEATTVAATMATTGDEVGEGDEVLVLAAVTRQVIIDVPLEITPSVSPGTTVRLGTAGNGTVSLLRSVERDGEVVVQAVITPDESVTGIEDGGSVSVTIPVSSHPGVLIVPTEALLSRLDGQYGVQVRGAGGAVAWVSVELVAVSGNQAAIRADGLAAGTEVILPV